MRAFIKKNFQIIYYSIIFLTIVGSISLGQVLEATVESKSVFSLDINLNAWIMTLLIIVFTCIYAILFYFGLKFKYINLKNKKVSYFIPAFLCLIILVYMIFLIAFKDNSHLYSLSGYEIYPTILGRYQSICSFYLSILTIMAFTYLVIPAKNLKRMLNVLGIILLTYFVISMIYSFIKDSQSYSELFSNPRNLFSKNYSNLAHSFYTNSNVFAHTLFIGVITVLFLSFVNDNPLIFIASLAFVPSFFASYCRAAIINYAFLVFIYLGYLIYYFYHKKMKKTFIIYSLIYALLLIFLIVDTFIFKLVKIPYNDKTYTFYDLFNKSISLLNEQRFSITSKCLENADSIDFIFGLGYNLEFIVPRANGTYCYYFHDSYVELFMAGGIFYTLFIMFFYGKSFITCLKLRHQDPNLLAFFILVSASYLLYGLFESPVMLFNNFWGGALGFYLVALINIKEVNCQ